MIQQGNLKLGKKIHNWSLPPEITCPGASPTCLGVCYGSKGHYHSPVVINALARNFKASKSRDFVSWMVHEIRENYVRIFRPHVVGDFYNGAYIRKWISIVRRSPEVAFYIYTRTWNVPEYFEPIKKLALLPNMQLWLSFDQSMPVPPKIEGAQWCYLAVNDADHPPQKTDLVFREERRTVMKVAKYHSPVCAYETGLTKTTCSKCRMCWEKAHESIQTQAVNASSIGG